MLKSIPALALLFFSAAITLAPGAGAGTIRVPEDHATIQGAIDAAADGDAVVVADGTYVENIDFAGKKITVVSENGPAGAVIDGGGIGNAVNFSNGEDQNAVLDGFTVTNGSAVYGGGIYISGAAPVIRNCTITGNSAINVFAGSGGGVCVLNSSPTIQNCAITANHADQVGGGLYLKESNSSISGLVISENAAKTGGGIHISSGSPEINGCVIRNNSSADIGGGLACSYATPVIINSVISKNASRYGGGLHSYYATPEITNCTVSGNSASDPVNGTGAGGGIYVRYDEALIHNSIFWGNTAETGDKEIYISSADATVTYSNVEQASGVYTGTGNINAAPVFVDAAGDDYHLASDSPCIDSADPSSLLTDDMDGDARPQCEGFDMGADEVAITAFYADADADGYGDPGVSEASCSLPDGYVPDNTDCDDADPDEHPGQIWYKDADDDGYGDGTTDTDACTRPAGYKTAAELTAVSGDDDDGDGTVHPGAEEICDGKDNNQDGRIDEGVAVTYYADADGDGYGDPNAFQAFCSLPDGYVADNTDCDDADPDAHPGQIWYKDADDDGYGDGTTDTDACTRPAGYKTAAELVAVSGDDDDGDGTVHPGAEEICDGKDNNQDGRIDEGVTVTYYADADGDGYGDPNTAQQACAPPDGYVANPLDNCVDDPNKTEPGVCGCGTPDSDTDGDEILDCHDAFENDPVVPGDVNNDGAVDLEDLIFALQVISGVVPSADLFHQADIDGDDHIGCEEAVHAFQITSGIND